ncbi:hypothetical protein [Salegentibacter sediminis]|uniref:hypothetical protein n=1 Tax=Salegentibacter sediminis TaxID=1930251 RepID=UPI0009C031DE|nr:hypothetical protein [Salegentibacter sediminis]
MGKNNGILSKIEGTLDNITFYKTQDGSLVKTKSGVSKKRILRDPAFARTRENMSEFTSNAQAGKLMRQSVNDILQRAKDNRLTSRLTKVMSEIQKFDSTSVRGQRSVAVGIQDPEALALLNDFNFNINAPLASILKAVVSIDTLTGEVGIPNFIPNRDIVSPEGATHVSLQGAYVKTDFGLGTYECSVSPVENLALDNTSTDVSLIPDSVPGGTGVVFILLLAEFFQEVNTVQYGLRNGAFNSLCILATA